VDPLQSDYRFSILAPAVAQARAVMVLAA
jgi:hypothetical protein